MRVLMPRRLRKIFHPLIFVAALFNRSHFYISRVQLRLITARRARVIKSRFDSISYQRGKKKETGEAEDKL